MLYTRVQNNLRTKTDTFRVLIGDKEKTERHINMKNTYSVVLKSVESDDGDAGSSYLISGSYSS